MLPKGKLDIIQSINFYVDNMEKYLGGKSFIMDTVLKHSKIDIMTPELWETWSLMNLM